MINKTKNGLINYSIIYDGKESESEILKNIPIARLTEMEQIGESNLEWSNRLIIGDNLPTLKTLCLDSMIYKQVKLIYIDPPFSTRQVFKTKQLWYRSDTGGKGGQLAYGDDLDGATYLDVLRRRLILLKELLADDGSIYVHLDSNMAFAVKILMDEIFGPHNFRTWITRQKCSTKNYTRNIYGNISDYILFYTKSDNYVWHRPYESWNENRVRKEYNRVEKDTGRKYKLVPIHAQGIRHGATGRLWRDMMPPPGKHWQFIPEKLDEFDRRGEIHWSATGNPRRKVYFDSNSKGIPMQDIWTGFRDAINQNTVWTEYPTEKNLDMLKLIISTSSNIGDIVLDAFVGSGTTCHAAVELDRRWIGIDSSELAIDIAKKRLITLIERNMPQLQGQFEFDNEEYKERHRSFIVLRAEI